MEEEEKAAMEAAGPAETKGQKKKASRAEAEEE
jgi:hypothetical protein